MKTFSFPENSIFGKYLFFGNTFTRTKRSLGGKHSKIGLVIKCQTQSVLKVKVVQSTQCSQWFGQWFRFYSAVLYSPIQQFNSELVQYLNLINKVLPCDIYFDNSFIYTFISCFNQCHVSLFFFFFKEKYVLFIQPST